jgi:hypothetical protein
VTCRYLWTTRGDGGCGPAKVRKRGRFKKSSVASDDELRSHHQTKRPPADKARPTLSRFEVNVLATQSEIDGVAERIQHAYCVRRPGWRGGCSSSRVWQEAAKALIAIHASDPSLPCDPELYVLAQPMDSLYADPWTELTGLESLRRYRRCVRGIVRGLRRELTAEVRFAEEKTATGQPIGRVLGARGRGLSPLGRYIVARRAGRIVLARRFLAEVVAQHHACPLYRLATAGLLPAGAYPVSDDSDSLSTVPSKTSSPAPAAMPWN